MSRFQRCRVTCRRLLTIMLVTIGLAAVAATPSNAAARSIFPSPTVCSAGPVSDPRLSSTRFGDFVSVSASVYCNVSYSMSIDLTLISPGGETTRHFEKTQPDQVEVTGTVSRTCDGPGWYLGRATFDVSAPGLGFHETTDSQWVFFWCGVIRFP